MRHTAPTTAGRSTGVLLLAAAACACSDDSPVDADPGGSEDAVLALSAASMDLAATEGDDQPATATLDVTNEGDGSIDGLDAVVSYPGDTPTDWLTVSLDGSGTPAVLSVAASATDLGEGTYTAIAAVTSEQAANDSVATDVTFVVEAAPVPSIALSATAVDFAATEGGSDPADETVEVTNDGDGTLDGLGATVAYPDGQPTDWLEASLDGTTAPAALTLSATTGSLTAGEYEAAVDVTADAADDSPRTIAATVTVSEPPMPDLVIVDPLDISPDTVDPGDPVDFEAWTGRNQGDADAGESSNGYYLSTDSAITHDDTRLDGGAGSSIGAGEEVEWAAGSVTIPAETEPGDYHFGILVDEDDDIEESDETNNYRSAPLVVADPDARGDDAGPLDVVINEVNWYGNGQDATDEWIEIRNVSGGELNLSGWIIENAGAGDAAVTLDDGTVLADGAYLVIGAKKGENAEGERTSLTGVDGVQIQPVGLSNFGEQLVLRDVEGTLIDSTPTGDWPAGDEDSFHSMERFDEITGGGYSAGDDVDAWYTWNDADETDTTSSDTDDSGTPGAHNSDPFAF
ncbi:MAG: lamin tail domain-containing protein [Gemmatimonadota bacterium]